MNEIDSKMKLKHKAFYYVYEAVEIFCFHFIMTGENFETFYINLLNNFS